jgi:hypothetical protein
MTISVLVLADKLNPVEIQTWLDSHTTVTIDRILMQDNIVYIFYTI